MKKLLLSAIAALAATTAVAQDDAVKTLCVGRFENPTKAEAECGDHSWWQRYPYQWFTVYCGGQFIYQPEYLQQMADDNAQITEIAFKYGDEGVVQEVLADLSLYIQNTEITEFEKKPNTADTYLWAAFDPDAPHAVKEYAVELYYYMDEEIHFVLDRPLDYTGKSILITTWSDRHCDDPGSGTAYVSYSTPTDAPTTMTYGSDREQFLDVYDTGEQYAYQPPQNLMPIIKFYYTSKADGIASVETDAAAAPEYFNLQGVRQSGRLAPGIYVRRTGATAEKVVVR